MPAAHDNSNAALPEQFNELVRQMPPQALVDDAQHARFVEMIDRLMGIDALSEGQAIYLETLVQLVERYEATHHAIETSDITGLDSLRHLLTENNMNASDLGRLLGVHPSMGSKILNGERSLTVDHLKTLAAHFRVSPSLFIDDVTGTSKVRSKSDKDAA